MWGIYNGMKRMRRFEASIRISKDLEWVAQVLTMFLACALFTFWGAGLMGFYPIISEFSLNMHFVFTALFVFTMLVAGLSKFFYKLAYHFLLKK